MQTVQTIDAAVTAAGEVVLPPEIRRLLGLTGEARIRFVVDDESVRLTVPRRRYPHTLESVFGSLPGRVGVSADLDDEIEEAMAAFQGIRRWRMSGRDGEEGRWRGGHQRRRSTRLRTGSAPPA